MKSYLLRVSAPVRYAFLPSYPQRTVGNRLLPGDTLVLDQKQRDSIHLVAEGDVKQTEVMWEEKGTDDRPKRLPMGSILSVDEG